MMSSVISRWLGTPYHVQYPRWSPGQLAAAGAEHREEHPSRLRNGGISCGSEPVCAVPGLGLAVLSVL